VFVHQAAEYQGRRGEEKRKEAERRQSLLAQAPVDVTPANKGQFVWSEGDKTNIDQFEDKWSMKPVAIKGIFDHTREMQI
jgi:cytochrome oxidase assembly protein ShyY1